MKHRISPQTPGAWETFLFSLGREEKKFARHKILCVNPPQASRTCGICERTLLTGLGGSEFTAEPPLVPRDFSGKKDTSIKACNFTFIQLRLCSAVVCLPCPGEQGRLFCVVTSVKNNKYVYVKASWSVFFAAVRETPLNPAAAA